LHELAEISGIDTETKTKLKDYCKRNALTQIEWVAYHLLHDLKEEEYQRKQFEEYKKNFQLGDPT
jgi:hypothetical protein